MEVNSPSSDSILAKVTPPPFSQHQTQRAGNEAEALRSLCLQTNQEWQ